MESTPVAPPPEGAKRFWIALVITLAPFVFIPFIVSLLIPQSASEREVGVLVLSAISLFILEVLTLVVGIVTLARSSTRRIGSGVMAGLGVGVVVGFVTCYAATAI